MIFKRTKINDAEINLEQVQSESGNLEQVKVDDSVTLLSEEDKELITEASLAAVGAAGSVLMKNKRVADSLVVRAAKAFLNQN